MGNYASYFRVMRTVEHMLARRAVGDVRYLQADETYIQLARRWMARKLKENRYGSGTCGND